MEQLQQTMQTMLWNITHRTGLADIVDILIVAVIIYELMMLTRQTRSSAVLKGLFFLLVAVGISNLLGLTALNWLLMSIISNGALVLLILFQPELRHMLENLGRGAMFDRSRTNESESPERITREIIKCLMDLSHRKVGALLVFEQGIGLKDVCETGISIDAEISSALLENIFEPNTPLHDGAVVIRGTRVTAGACILPLSENHGISHDLGTRHRAGLGVSESTDALVLIASEETGILSMAKGGHLTRNLDEAELRKILDTLYRQKQGNRVSRFWTSLWRKEDA